VHYQCLADKIVRQENEMRNLLKDCLFIINQLS
jgi:hypothetical protein